MEDLFINGQCYPVAQLGESCQISEQCTTMDEESLTKVECNNGFCKCPHGYGEVGGICKSKYFCLISIKTRLL